MTDRTHVSRRTALIAGATASSAALLAACGLGGTQQPAKPAEVKGTLTTWMPAPTVSFREGTGGEVMEQFKKQYPTLTVDNVDEGSGDKLKTTVAAGTPPDFFHTQSYWQTTWGVTGITTQLDDYVKASKVIRLDDVWPLKLKEVQHRGKTWALPYSIDSRVIYINADHY